MSTTSATPPTPAPRVLAPLAFAAGLAALYFGALTSGFLNDDYLFLEDARRQGFAAMFAPGGGLENFFRPLSREAWFAALTPIAGGRPELFHAANFALFLGACALLWNFLRERTSESGAWIATLWFATLPLQRVNLTWISCNQDLLALTTTLAAFASWRAKRPLVTAIAYALALASKEVAAPLPLALFLWSTTVERRPTGETLRRLAPLALPLALWTWGEWHLRSTNPAAAVLLVSPASALATLLHLAQSLIGLDAPEALGAALALARPSLLALAALALVALAWPATNADESRAHAEPAPPAPDASLPRFAIAWAIVFALPVIPVAHFWSAYYFTLSAAGAALAVAWLARRATRTTWLASTLVLLLWHALVSAAPSFAVVETPWSTTSHLTAHYFERGAQLTSRMRAALARVEPSPVRGTRFWFATLPEFAGFQMGNGPAIRDLYRDPTLESYFYSQFAESTAAEHACVFLFWNGVDFERLYASARDPFFQVGTDLLLLDRPAGAAWAFRRALANGESASEVYPWLGWAQLWRGRRAEAEAAWTRFGAADDPVLHVAHLRAAKTALDAGDTTSAKRALFDAMKAGIGRPEPHAVLGELLRAKSPKFALLETLVATRLQPDDWRARRDLVAGMLEARLDDRAATELAALRRIHPNWSGDPIAAGLERTLAARRAGAPDRGSR